MEETQGFSGYNPMKRIIVNVQTGEKTTVDLTPQEVQEIADRHVPAPQVPRSVTMRQARLALLSTGLLTQVDDAVQTMKDAAGDAARIEWEYAGTVDRQWPLVVALGTSLGITDEQLDGLFRLAATL